ncbi:MAG: ATP-binding protein, partial [Pseudanabaena sp. M151S2SP2A07QC]|nr:ATP-binding protein [Pseudanabaena sp. M151S2SP2A07QC]
MSILDQATSGVLIRPQVYTVYGPNGVGKTTLACSFEEPIILDLEDGSGFVGGVKRLGSGLLPDFATVESTVTELLSAKHTYKTLVIDSLEALESLISKALCEANEVDSIEAIGFGKGYVMAREKMEGLMLKLRGLRDAKKMNVIIVAHSTVKSFNDPKSNSTYDRYILRSNDKLASVVKDLSDSIFFINNKVLTQDSKQNPNKSKAFSTGERVIHTVWSHAYDAKSRYPVKEEISFTLDNVSQVVEELKPKSGEDVLFT